MGNYCCQDNTVGDPASTTLVKLSMVSPAGREKTSSIMTENQKEHAHSTIDKFFVTGTSTGLEKVGKSQPIAITPATEQASTNHSFNKTKENDTKMEMLQEPKMTAPLEGFCKHQFPNGGYYEGQWHNYLQEGKGKYVYPTGDFYDGRWSGGKANGHGRFVSTGGYVYEGDWVNDLQDGEGEERHEDGTVFKGRFCLGKKNGIGRLEQPDGSYYEGEFKDNNFHGTGEYVWPHQRYKGQWGVCQWQDGRIYVGQYQYGKKHGYGEFRWPDGRSFKGEWRNGCRIKGVLMTSDGVLKQIGEARE